MASPCCLVAPVERRGIEPRHGAYQAPPADQAIALAFSVPDQGIEPCRCGVWNRRRHQLDSSGRKCSLDATRHAMFHGPFSAGGSTNTRPTALRRSPPTACRARRLETAADGSQAPPGRRASSPDRGSRTHRAPVPETGGPPRAWTRESDGSGSATRTRIHGSKGRGPAVRRCPRIGERRWGGSRRSSRRCSAPAEPLHSASPLRSPCRPFAGARGGTRTLRASGYGPLRLPRTLALRAQGVAPCCLRGMNPAWNCFTRPQPLRQESNLHSELRRLVSYPLDDAERIRGCGAANDASAPPAEERCRPIQHANASREHPEVPASLATSRARRRRSAADRVPEEGVEPSWTRFRRPAPCPLGHSGRKHFVTPAGVEPALPR